MRVYSVADLESKALMARRDASDALGRAATVYRVIAELPRRFRSAAMRACVDRPYLLECNPRRWPDGKYHLLDRHYRPWLGHDVAHYAADLRAVGLESWRESSAVQVEFLKSCVPLVDDALQRSPRPGHLHRLAEILDALAALHDAPLERPCDAG